MSALANKYVSDPHDIVRSGQVVKVKVMDVDVERHRIGLSMRLDDEPGQPATRKRGGDQRGSGHGRRRTDRQGDRRGDRRGGNKAAPQGAMADALKKAGFGR